LKANSARHTWIGSLLVGFALMSLTGCQLLGNNQTQVNNSVVVTDATMNFGKVAVGNSKSMANTLTNFKTSPVTIVSVAGLDSDFQLDGMTLPFTLNPGQAAGFTVKFQPSKVGTPSKTLQFGDNAEFLASVAVSGNAVDPGQLALNPASVSFGSVKIGSNKTSTVTISNSGSTDVTINNAALSGASFSMSNLTLPLTLTPGGSTSFTVTFAPTGTGSFTGSVSFSSTSAAAARARGLGKSKAAAGDDVTALALSGTGISNPGTLSANPASLSFGSVQIGTSSSKSETLTNTGSGSVTISQANISGTGMSVVGLTLPTTLAQSQSVSFTVKFSPAAAGAVSGTLAIVSDATNSPLNIAVSGTGVTPGQLTPNPSSLAFGSVQVGSSTTLAESVTNTGGMNVTISQANVTGAGFSVTGLTLPLTLTPGQAKSFNVKFAPSATGSVSGNVALVSDAPSSPLNVGLTGDGLAAGSLTANPTSVNFGSVVVGNNQTTPVVVTNSGGASVTISTVATTGNSFSFTGPTVPLTLTAGQSATFNAIFTPPSAGNKNGTLTITSNASNPTLTVPLQGTGVAQGQLTPTPTSLSFGNVVIGNNQSLTETLTNSGGSSLTISAATVTGSGMSISGLSLPLTLTAGQSTTFSVKFAPAATGAVSGNVTITSNGSNPTLNIPVSGTGVTPGTLSPNPASLAFGSVQVGNTSSLSETLTNSGGTPVTISQANVTGTGFSITGLTLPATLTAGQSVTFTAKFSPTATGAASGNLAVVSDAPSSPLNIAMSGTGTAPGQLAVSPTTLSFGTVVVGTGSAKTGTLNATGASVTVTSANSSDGEFVLSGITFPKTIAAGNSASFTVTFTPAAAGSASGTLTFLSNASNAPTIQNLNGTGQTPPSHSVDLSWNASGTSDVVGYNIYRRTSSGSYGSPVNASLNTDLTFTDNGVSAGQTYFYVVRAVDSNDVESVNSNEVQAVIPTP